VGEPDTQFTPAMLYSSALYRWTFIRGGDLWISAVQAILFQ